MRYKCVEVVEHGEDSRVDSGTYFFYYSEDGMSTFKGNVRDLDTAILMNANDIIVAVTSGGCEDYKKYKFDPSILIQQYGTTHRRPLYIVREDHPLWCLDVMLRSADKNNKYVQLASYAFERVSETGEDLMV